MLGHLLGFDRRVEVVGESKIDDVELVHNHVEVQESTREGSLDLILDDLAAGNQFLCGVLCGHRLDGFLDGGIDDAFLEENADFLVDGIDLTRIHVVVQRDRGRNRLQVLGGGRGGGLCLFDLYVDRNYVLDKGRLESDSFVENPILYATDLAEYHPALASADHGERIVQHQQYEDTDGDLQIGDVAAGKLLPDIVVRHFCSSFYLMD